MLLSWIGGAPVAGVSIPDKPLIGSPVTQTQTQTQTPADTIFIQNDGDKTPTSPWYVKQVDATHFTMVNAVAPKGWQYLGAFIIKGETGDQIGRAEGAVWTFSNPEIVKHISTSASGQAAISILKAGTCTLTVALRDMVSTLVITAT